MKRIIIRNLFLLAGSVLASLSSASAITLNTMPTTSSVMTSSAKSSSKETKSIAEMKFRDIARYKSDEWFASAEAKAIADSVMLYQQDCGGWPKNQQWQTGAEQKEMQKCKKTGIGATIDNYATTIEMLYMSRMYAATHEEQYRQSFMKGLSYLIEAQYDNGGWPQYYPFKKMSHGKPFYSDHVTFNDNAMVNVMRVLRDLGKGASTYDCLNLSDSIKEACQVSFDKGVQCILDCQIRVNGVPTVWCQQYDEKTLLPVNARAFELASFTGCGETPDILKLLMTVKKPSDELVQAVGYAIDWLKAHQMNDVAIEKFVNADGKKDYRLVEKKGAAPLWARYYDLKTEKPFYCDRDGVERESISDIGYERRNGYRWIDSDPQEVIDKYPTWLKKVRP